MISGISFTEILILAHLWKLILSLLSHIKLIMSLYCVFADDKSDSIFLHVSFAREKQPRRRETREVKYLQLKLCL